jgi:hypothetical protein
MQHLLFSESSMRGEGDYTFYTNILFVVTSFTLNPLIRRSPCILAAAWPGCLFPRASGQGAGPHAHDRTATSRRIQRQGQAVCSNHPANYVHGAPPRTSLQGLYTIVSFFHREENFSPLLVLNIGKSSNIKPSCCAYILLFLFSPERRLFASIGPKYWEILNH